MKKAVFALLVVAVMLVASCCQQQANIEAEKSAIKAVLDQYVASIENEDMDAYARLVAKDSDMVNFGGFGDPIMGWDALKQTIEGQNAALSETKITVGHMNIHISETGTLAWATCLWNLKAKMGEAPVELPIRCTWVLEKRNNSWVIVHFHKSMPASG
jgi:uncharacterized protein (TIGR02246 family)